MDFQYRSLIEDPISADTKQRSSGMDKKTGFTVAESDRRLIRDHAYVIREALFSCMTDIQVESAVAFARFLNSYGINSDNYWLYLRMIMTNNPWVIDELLHEREPRLLFSTIRPDADLIDAAFQTLYSRHPGEIYPKALEALLGIIENAYFDPDDGYRIRKLTLMDINALGKFLLKSEAQDHPQNRLILDILDRMTHLNEYYQEPDKSVLSKQAFNVRYAYFDSTRNLVDAIPHPLLVHLSDTGKVPPAEDFVELVTKRRERRRDALGRFMKETPEVLATPEVKPNAAIKPDMKPNPSITPEPPQEKSKKPTPPPKKGTTKTPKKPK